MAKKRVKSEDESDGKSGSDESSQDIETKKEVADDSSSSSQEDTDWNNKSKSRKKTKNKRKKLKTDEREEGEVDDEDEEETTANNLPKVYDSDNPFDSEES